MAETETKKRSYPSIPGANWFDLRKRFQQSLPTRVDADYLQSVLTVGEGHARNLIPQIRSVGLIDAAGAPTDLAMDWRDDDQYASACARIAEAAYPSALRDALPPPSPDRGAVEQWFMRNAKVGQGAAAKMASFYLILCSGDMSSPAKDRKPKEGAKRRPKEQPSQASTKQSASRNGGSAPASRDSLGGPSVHVDVQVHIPPDASPDQIDQIFSAMAKHLYGSR